MNLLQQAQISAHLLLPQLLFSFTNALIVLSKLPPDLFNIYGARTRVGLILTKMFLSYYELKISISKCKSTLSKLVRNDEKFSMRFYSHSEKNDLSLNTTLSFPN